MNNTTEGPWERVDAADYAEIHPQGRRLRSPLALVANPGDADLIAAAPELLATLKGGNFTYLGGEYVLCINPDIAKAVIAKAEGKS